MLKLFKFLIKIFELNKTLYVAYDSGGKNKPTIVLLHGIAATSKTWGYLIKDLDVEKYRVIAIDLLGFGKSVKPKDLMYSVSDHSVYIHRTIKKLGVKMPYILAGHSMGSIISAHYCRLYPDEIKEVYLLSLPLYVKDSEFQQTKISEKQTDMFLKAYNFLANKKNIAMTSAKGFRKIFRLDDGMDINEDNWNSFRLSIKNTVINQTTFNDIKNIKVPIHIIYGLLDAFLVMDNVNKLEKLENISITKISGVHHAVNQKFSLEAANQISESLAK